ncbi:hypothetical protein DL89DRAFT_269499 [Linderina pennispora]|uniref:Ubiquitin-like domain-containing protein n=1 Tax=Linderina pennispora TaxID=61395 RepID=A0A1Y1W1R8_9FUNG|nr:uncharacterized protein DL89DRAFT_269499 [Linderina pennispora]ORX67064.1 hypothetical protein DL89DRAFT_269499 [Linderina pennispora]
MHIAEVKREIERQHPSAPQARDMRVIWKGRILNDDYPCNDDEAEEVPEPQTVHFVLNTPISGIPKQPTTHGAKQAEGQKMGAPAAADLAKDDGVPADSASIVPLGNQFQYVLVNGVPYLMELTPVGLDAPAARLDDPDDDTPIAQLMARTATTLSQYEQVQRLMAQTQAIVDRANARQDAGMNNPDVRPADHHGVPLDVFRSINFSAIWNAAWLLLRMALLVAVFAHDASWERLILLGALVLGFIVLQSRGVREGFARLNNANGERDNGTEGQPRVYSVWEKIKALAIALLTSLVPSEPFQGPLAEE